MSAEITVVQQNPHQDIIDKLRMIADEIERGDFGEAWSALLVLDSGGCIINFGLGVGGINTAVSLTVRGQRELLNILDECMERGERCV